MLNKMKITISSEQRGILAWHRNKHTQYIDISYMYVCLSAFLKIQRRHLSLHETNTV